MKTNCLSLLMLCVLVEFAMAAEPVTLKLWPDGPPTAMVPKSESTGKLIQSYGGVGPNRISDVSDPTITVFLPEKPNGTSVIVAPGGGFIDKDDKTKFRPGFSIPADAPPVFLLVAHDDGANPIEAAMLYVEYKKRDLSAELHICAKGGHGFGMRKDGKPINEWPQRCAEWMKSLGFLDAN